MSMLQRLSMMNASGIATQKNHGLPLAPVINQITKVAMTTPSQALMFVQSAGCCAGSAPMCFPAGEFATGDTDLLLGVIEGCPFYIDARIDQSWDYPQLVLDIAPGNPEGFSLGPSCGLQFVTGASGRVAS